jgi:hypothetical protein
MEALGVATGQGSAGVRIHDGSLREGSSSRTPTASVPTSSPRPEEIIYAQSVHLFLAAIAQGMPASAALKGFGTLGRGSLSHDDKCVFPENAALGLTADRIGHLSAARQLVVSSYEGEGDTTIFLLSSAVAAIASDRALCAPWADRSRRGEGGLEAKWLASGVLEFVAWDDRIPILLQPCGAVPKGTAPFYRLITDAQFSNKL